MLSEVRNIYFIDLARAQQRCLLIGPGIEIAIIESLLRSPLTLWPILLLGKCVANLERQWIVDAG